VHNLSLNHQRRTGKIIPLDSHPAAAEPGALASDLPDPQPLPDEQIARLENIGLVRLSIETLDARSRELIRLKFEAASRTRKSAPGLDSRMAMSAISCTTRSKPSRRT
jgi:hypothetical protein